MSISVADITRMMNAPQSISEADKLKIDPLITSFPYFIPARYIAVAIEHKKQPFSGPMMEELKYYKGNWLLLNDFLDKATGRVFDDSLKESIEVNDNAERIAIPRLSKKEHEVKNVQNTATTPVEPKETLEVKAIPKAIVSSQAEPAISQLLQPTLIPEAPVTESPKEKTEIKNDNELKTSKKDKKEHSNNIADEPVIQPLYTEDYFRHQGVDVSNNIPESNQLVTSQKEASEEEDKSLMVVMSFTEWLSYFKTKTEKQKEEEQDKKALKTMWQKEKLAAAMEEENEEIPEGVFEMAVNSITKEDDLASESLAEIYVKQKKYDQAIEMYRKLSLRNPQKSSYFARKIETILKEKQS